MNAISRMKLGETVEQILAGAAAFGWRSALSAAIKARILESGFSR